MGVFKQRKQPRHLASVVVLAESVEVRQAAFVLRSSATEPVVAEQARILACLAGWAETFSFGGREGQFDFISTLAVRLDIANSAVQQSDTWDGIELVHDELTDVQDERNDAIGEIYLTSDNLPIFEWTWSAQSDDGLDPDLMMVCLLTLYEQSLREMTSTYGCSILLVAMKLLHMVIEHEMESLTTAEGAVATVGRIYESAVTTVSKQVRG